MKKFLRKIRENKRIIFCIILLFVVLFSGVNFVFAKTETDVSVGKAVVGIASGTLGSAVALVLSWIAYIITALLGLIITALINLTIQIAQFNNIIGVPTVVKGWVIIRDLCNMFFILILLVIAFATILRQENYSIKKMLPKLLIMAVLINFSRTIFGLLIDFSQVIMLTFASSFKEGGGWFVDMFNINAWGEIKQVTKLGSDEETWGASSWGIALAVIAGVIASIITLIVVAVMLAVLVMRVIMLWIYTIFSPLVFLGFAFPPLKGYTDTIWKDFIKQLVVGPVLAFFIWLALTTASDSSSAMYGLTGTSDEICVGAGAFFCSESLQKFIIVIGLLMGGLMVAQQAGGAAGSIAGKGMDWAKTPGKLAAWGGKKLGGFVEQKFEEHGMPYLTRGYWQGFGARGERLRDWAKTRAMGKGEKLAEERWKPKFWEKRAGAMDVAETRRREVINKIMADLQKSLGATAEPRQEMQHQAKLAFEAEGIEGEQRREAIIEMATQKGNFDDIYMSLIPHFQNQIKEGKMKKEDFEKRFGMDIDEAQTYSVNTVRKFMAGYLEVRPEWAEAAEMPEEIENGTKDEQKAWLEKSRVKIQELLETSGSKEQNSLRTMAAASEVAKNVGHWEQFNTVKDDIIGKYKMMPEPDRHEEVIGEFRKRPIADTLAHTATHPMRVTKFNPETGEWYRSGRWEDQQGPEKRFTRDSFSGTHVRDIHRSQARMSLHVAGIYYDDTGKIIADDEVARERGFNNVNDLKNSQEEMRNLNKVVFDGLYKLRFYGNGSSPLPVYGDPGWKSSLILTEEEVKERSTHMDEVKKAITLKAVKDNLETAGLHLSDKKTLDIQKTLTDFQYINYYAQPSQTEIKIRVEEGVAEADAPESLKEDAREELAKDLDEKLKKFEKDEDKRREIVDKLLGIKVN